MIESSTVNCSMATTDPRTGLEIIDEEECWELVAGKQIGRLAVSIANDPDVFPLNYRVDDKTIVIRTLPGLKLAAAVLGNPVAFEIDDIREDTHSGWSVVIHGYGQEIGEVEDRLHAEDLEVQPWAAGEKSRYMRIVPDRISGRRVTSHDD